MGTESVPEATITIRLFFDSDEQPSGFVLLDPQESLLPKNHLLEWALVVLCKHLVGLMIAAK